ncbi:MAG: hypothetical protein JWN66_1816 [Sphingomonas bacterium]|uniref:ROK family transcriptional regulator n=1 Tax=Sphingomonas bacterium TaxID=1895847 RepID=UPI0026262BAE|nr:ROK family transcriptional regulator [Sphingomonas bacterium]MDB5704700.1 hypothetical protein [Sphingomonas bacterium]
MRFAGTAGDSAGSPMASLTTRERSLLALLRGRGPLPRSDIARLMDLSGPAVFRATEDLARLGLVEIGPGVIQGRGQPSALASLNAGAFLTAGLAVMSDRAEAVLMDLSGAIIGADEVSAPGMQCDAIADNLQAFITYVCSKRGIPPDRVGAVGVAVAGYFIREGTMLNTSPELDDWALVEFRTRMAARLGRPVEIENVARAAAVGEAILGVGRWAPSFAYLNIAAGLGCGIIVDGELMRGRWGNAGEIGALPERLGAVKPTLERLCEILAENGVATDGVGDMLAAYQASWPGLDQWIAEAAPALSTLALILHYTLDLDAVVIGGRLPPDLAQRLVEAITWLDDDRPARRGKPLPRPRIVAAELTAQSAAIGAASVPLKRLFFSPPASTETG